LQQNDILLSLGGQPLAVAADVAKQLKAAGESAVPLKLLRAGTPITIQVRPIYRVTLGPATQHKTEYFIGVSINPLDDAVRAQLSLRGGLGVVVNDVIAGSPAEKAGVKKHDILLEMGGKRIESPEALMQLVQAGGDKPTTLKLLRAGKPMTLPIVPAVRQVEVSVPEQALRVWLASGDPFLEQLATQDPAKVRFPDRNAELTLRLDRLDKELKSQRSGERSLRRELERLDRVEQELKALRAALEKLNQTLKAQRRD
jgi:C-terminal processing protease CtpA/Prc